MSIIDAFHLVMVRHVTGYLYALNKLRPRRKGHHIAHDIFKLILMGENCWILTKISLKFVPRGSVKQMSAFNGIMAWVFEICSKKAEIALIYKMSRQSREGPKPAYNCSVIHLTPHLLSFSRFSMVSNLSVLMGDSGDMKIYFFVLKI